MHSSFSIFERGGRRLVSRGRFLALLVDGMEAGLERREYGGEEGGGMLLSGEEERISIAYISIIDRNE